MDSEPALVDLTADTSTDEDVLLQLTLMESLRSQTSYPNSISDFANEEHISGSILRASSSSSSSESIPGVKRKRVAARTRSTSHLASNQTPHPEPASTERQAHNQRPLPRSISHGALTSKPSASRIPSTSGGLTRATLLAQQRRAQQALEAAEKLSLNGKLEKGWDRGSTDEDDREGITYDDIDDPSRLPPGRESQRIIERRINELSLANSNNSNHTRRQEPEASIPTRSNQRSAGFPARDRSDFVSAATLPLSSSVLPTNTSRGDSRRRISRWNDPIASGMAAMSTAIDFEVPVEVLDQEIVLEGHGLGSTSNSSTSVQTNGGRVPNSRRGTASRRGGTRSAARGRGVSPPAPMNDEELALMLQQQELMGLDQSFSRLSRRSFVYDDFGFVGAASSPRIPINMNAANYMDDEELDTSYEGLWRLAERIGDVKPKGAPASLVMALPVKQFSRRPNMTEEQLKCSICISEYEEGDEQQVLPCLHCFHSECVQQWLKQSNACPICRLAVTEE